MMVPTSLNVSCTPPGSPTGILPQVRGLGSVVVTMMMTTMMTMVTTMKILLALADMVDAIGNPEPVVRLVLLVLLREGCHLVPEED